jgi:hypothetical protein
VEDDEKIKARPAVTRIRLQNPAAGQVPLVGLDEGWQIAAENCLTIGSDIPIAQPESE